jgi:small subunit ribosomal protein S6
MNQYEVTFIVDPVLSGDEIKATAQTYVEHLEGKGCKIVHVDEMGLRQLAYPINRRTSGVYYCIEFQAETGAVLEELELVLRRDERVMRFLTVKLDKYGVKYNDDKRQGKIGKVKKKPKKEDSRGRRRDNRGDRRQGGRNRQQNRPPKPAPATEPSDETKTAPEEN